MGGVDRKKHDVDIIERVLGHVRDGAGPDERSTSLLDVDIPWFGGSTRSTVELTVGLPLDSPPRSPSTGDRER
jgi:hypothetical protein